MPSLADFLLETRGQTPWTTARVFCNKCVYLALRGLAAGRKKEWIGSRWHWYQFPLSLRGGVFWSKPLKAWFYAGDVYALECMLHLPRYEPVNWLAPKPGQVVLDIGADVGWYTIQASRAVGHSGTVIALEPDAHNANQLEQNLRLNGLSNVRVLRKAAWSHSGIVGWHESAVAVWHKVSPEASAKVEAVTVDELAGQLGLGRVDWIKLDVEGGEIEVLRGAWQTLEQFHPVLLIEVHETLAQLRELLEPTGWVIESLGFDLAPERHGWVRCVHVARQAG